MLGKNALPRAEVGNPIYAEDWNKLVAAIELLLVARGGEDYVSNSSGVFPAGKKSESRRYRLDADLVGGSGDGALATGLAFDGTDWVDAGAQKTIYGSFISGTLPADTKVQCLVAGGRLEVIGGGASQSWGKATQTKSAYEVVLIQTYTGLPLTGTVTADAPIKVIALKPVIEGVPGTLVTIPTLSVVDGPDTVTLCFQPFVEEYECVAAEDWTSGTIFNVTVATGPIAASKTVVAMAPDIPGLGMSGVRGWLEPVFGKDWDWQFIPLGCVGDEGGS